MSTPQQTRVAIALTLSATGPRVRLRPTQAHPASPSPTAPERVVGSQPIGVPQRIYDCTSVHIILGRVPPGPLLHKLIYAPTTALRAFSQTLAQAALPAIACNVAVDAPLPPPDRDIQRFVHTILGSVPPGPLLHKLTCAPTMVRRAFSQNLAQAALPAIA
jgi:hypothetical protein